MINNNYLFIHQIISINLDNVSLLNKFENICMDIIFKTVCQVWCAMSLKMILVSFTTELHVRNVGYKVEQNQKLRHQPFSYLCECGGGGMFVWHIRENGDI